MNIDDPRFPELLTRAVWRAELTDNPEVFLMAGGHDLARDKAARILTDLRTAARQVDVS